MLYLYSLVALDIAHERTADALKESRVRRQLAAGVVGHSWLGSIRAAVARATAVVSVAMAALARRIDSCAASEVLVEGPSAHAA